MAAPHTPRRRRPVLTVLAGLALLGVLSVALLRVVPPPMTFLMSSRAASGAALDYRWRSLDDISPSLVEAVIAAEDADFCGHYGFDVDAIEKAVRENARNEARGRDRLRGGSTISQQTAKNVFLWPGRDWVRKGLEAGYTLMIETLWGKRRIMEVYLNVAEWAPGVYGAQAASQHWFDKDADDLTNREAARLAAILPSPRRYQAAAPGPYVRRRASRIQAAMGTVRNNGLATCALN